MKIKEFDKLIKKEKPSIILVRYINNQIYLTNKQLIKVLKLKDEEIGRWRK